MVNQLQVPSGGCRLARGTHPPHHPKATPNSISLYNNLTRHASSCWDTETVGTQRWWGPRNRSLHFYLLCFLPLLPPAGCLLRPPPVFPTIFGRAVPVQTALYRRYGAHCTPSPHCLCPLTIRHMGRLFGSGRGARRLGSDERAAPYAWQWQWKGACVCGAQQQSASFAQSGQAGGSYHPSAAGEGGGVERAKRLMRHGLSLRGSFRGGGGRLGASRRRRPCGRRCHLPTHP